MWSDDRSDRRRAKSALGRWRAFVGTLLLLALPGASRAIAERPDLLWMNGGHGGSVVSLVYSPDGQMVVSAGGDYLKLWRASDGTPLRVNISSYNFTSVAFSTDGQFVASVCGAGDPFYVGRVRILRVADGSTREWRAHYERPSGVALSVDGQIVATSCSYENSIVLWRFSDGAGIRKLDAPKVTAIQFSPDGQTLAAGCGDNYIRIFRVSDGALLRIMIGPIGVRSLAFSPDGQTMAAGGGGDYTIRLTRVSDGAFLRRLTGHTDSVLSVKFSRDSLTLASGSADRGVKLWRVSDGAELRTLTGHTGAVQAVDFSGDGQTLASGSQDASIRFWRVADGALVRLLIGHTSGVGGVDFSPNGQMLASGSGDKTVKFWRASDGGELRTLTGHTISLSSVDFSPDGQTLASGSRDGYTKLWRVSDGQLLRSLGSFGSVRSVAISPDGQMVASACGDKTVRLSRVSDGELLRTLTGHVNQVNGVAFSPDGQTLASVSGAEYYGEVALWRVSDGELLRMRFAHSDVATCTAFSPDSQILASGGSWFDRSVILWRVSDFAPLLRVGVPLYVDSIAFSADMQLLFASGGGTIFVWRVADGTLLKTYDEELVGPVTVSPDGKLLGYGRGDGIVAVAYNPTLLPTLFVCNKGSNTLEAYRGANGQFIRPIADPNSGLDYPNGVLVYATDELFISSSSTDKVIKYDTRTGAKKLELGSPQLIAPTGMLMNDPNNLLVASYGNNSVEEFKRTNGQWVRTFVAPGSGGLNGPECLARAANGNLLISSGNSDQVLEYDRTSGAFVRVAAEGNGLRLPTGLVVDPNGNLLVASYLGDSVLQFAADGSFLGEFVRPGSGGVDGPQGLAWTANGNLLVVSRFTNQVLEYDRQTGAYEGEFAVGGALNEPTYLAAAPMCEVDCNGNGIMDRWDIYLGLVTDLNHNAIADACEGLADLDCDGEVTFGDIGPFVLALSDPGEYEQQYPNCTLKHGDCDGEGLVGFGDINPFVELLSR